ncbi:MAG: hypothetical protein HY060_06365, partial [Proteobacteria bacterium]|nr:hypothetical protein [Pseudomonadota bacterium]
MADEDVYELHVCEAGRWSCVERFRSTEREEAIADAGRHFLSPTVEAVRVIREAFDQNEQVFKQRTVFRNAKPKTDVPTFTSKSTPNAPARKPPPVPARATPRPEPAKPPPRPESTDDATQLGSIKRAEPAALNATFTLVKRLLIAAGVGLVLSGLVFGALSTAPGGRLFEHVPDRLVYGGIVALFVASFFLSLYLFARTEARQRAARFAVAGAPPSALVTTEGDLPPQNW